MSRNCPALFLLCRSCVRNIFHGNALAGFFSVVVPAPKARQFQIPYKLIVYVASCYAMDNLLRQKQNNFFDDDKVIVCAGTKAGIGIDALAPVLNAMGDPLKTKTITLSCGKLTPGVTVRPWAGVFMLRNLKSPETYFQTAFRVQSPWEIKDEHGNREVVKQECYVFDFALERALHQISDYSCRLKVDDTSPEQKVSEFISFLPVLAFDGSSMNRIDAQDILDITYAGTSATLLAKRWQTALLVHVDLQATVSVSKYRTSCVCSSRERTRVSRRLSFG